MFKKLFTILLTVTLLFSTCCFATEPLPKPLIALSTPEGNKLFIRSYASSYFWPLTLNFVTQENLAYCGIASSVMVLNALQIPAPLFNSRASFRMFTQDNFFISAVEKIIPASKVKKQGVTLDQISQALKVFPVSVTTVHADKITLNEFRALAKKTIITQKGYLIINFLRTGLGENGSGHMSPLAAYDAKTDRFLLLDVAKYRYPVAWIKTQDLWNAMNTFDATAHAYRGFLIIKIKPANN